ncbi:Tn3 family transposase post-transcriptional regulator TnpC [Pseudomonas aeruginosa]|uniref:Tn3 family transposase post-transcriptional regulator TnpC n=1 Tax=Pseudomonas aeruginosa TaxID=287 RepID=UPI00157AEDFA|nr:Tn3 family transposase post-transcriptional regulator TnpC [Pseudomonas aeruginosa]MDY1221219.1 Tn3 family transposase post-transcriptional regulator TnpC [Pseudomonas aeruginosa]QKZ76886.1 transposase [Pseudomonas aeruginosa]HBP1920399.1 transposase [Pseudomonas aeruginosa]HBP1922928.1 transposase [Pseudomonas aeruginosa]HBP1976490.1 transposase [Pseudomonas aeruginosa]
MINIPPASFRATPCGEVDVAALEKLRNSFDTSQLLGLVDRLDTSLSELGGMIAVRDDLLKLHAISLALLEGTLPPVTTEESNVWEVAESVLLDLETLGSWIRTAQMTIAPLVDLMPEHRLRELPDREGN